MDENNNYFDLDSVNAQAKKTEQPVKQSSKGAFIGGIVTGLAGALAIVCLVTIIGKYAGGKNEGSSSGNPLQSLGSSQSSSFLTTDRKNKLEDLVEIIHDEFYLKEMTDEELETGIYRGLMDALDDPYSEYYTPEEFEELMTGSAGIYYGIGAYVSLDAETNYPKISGIIKGTPAEEAELRANDIIYMVDGVSTYGLTLSDAVALIKGEEFSEVIISVVRDGEKLDVPVVRRRVESPTVESQMLDDRMGYLQITEFDDVTSNQFVQAMEELKQQGMKGMILDLRSNPGGNLSTVVKIAQNLLPEGIIVYTEDKAGKRSNYRCKGDKEIQIPLVVLVDMNSASASEILAGAIQDYGKGTLIGTTTFGKGIVQSVMPLEDGSAIKITISSYYTPNGRNIHGIGIEPDIICEFDGSQYYNVENPVDNQLEKAKEVLTEMMK